MSVTVKTFMESCGENIPVELMAGEKGLSRPIPETAMNRPGLALAGFYKHFAFRRIQVLGMSENEYLADLSPSDRRACLRRLFSEHIPCLVVARNRKAFPELLELASEFKTPLIRTPMVTGKFINAATILMETITAPRATVQGTMVDIMGIGVLILGQPGIGKSEAALALVERGHSLVSDDVTIFHKAGGNLLVGSSPAVTRYHIEIRGLGIIHVPSLFGVAAVRAEKELDMAVSLVAADASGGEDVEGGGGAMELLGVRVPRVTVPVAAGRDLANIIEAAALNEKLKRLGHDAAKELDEKLITSFKDGTDARA